MDRLEGWKATAEEYPDPEHFEININLGWDKLNDYYARLDETPASYASAVLNPVFSRWGYFETTWTDQAQLSWLQEAKQMVRRLWEEEYKPLLALPVPTAEPPLKRLRVMSALERHRAYRTSTLPGKAPSSHGSLSADRDEYESWLSDPDATNDPLTTDPLRYWWERRNEYPRLSRMALDLLSIPPCPQSASDCLALVDKWFHRYELDWKLAR